MKILTTHLYSGFINHFFAMLGHSAEFLKSLSEKFSDRLRPLQKLFNPEFIDISSYSGLTRVSGISFETKRYSGSSPSMTQVFSGIEKNFAKFSGFFRLDNA